MKEYGENLEPIAQYYEANGQIISRRAFQYTGRDNIDVPLNKRSRPQVRGMLRGDMTYYLNDQLGSVTHITDCTGETLEQYRYDAFGSLMTPITLEYNTIGYTGQILDPKTGLMDYNARWYNPNIGRFTTEDTYEGDVNDPLSLNLYTYVKNNPLAYIDPSGHDPRELQLKLEMARDGELNIRQLKMIYQHTIKEFFRTRTIIILITYMDWLL
ncbi:RHS repeat-associated core domain-containing protein [Paenibacillus sp. S-12]|uniref:RHS repeat-associated core domain-containing protein n=1 Tax=Paenibacillus sp. S-12 TaxID=3031371 RepID=UPI0025A13D65|nr:RHS repeat-associated core domain-containing protein [Paenibacillus sp. S-12]